jgi:hypothetical protein
MNHARTTHKAGESCEIAYENTGQEETKVVNVLLSARPSATIMANDHF